MADRKKDRSRRRRRLVYRDGAHPRTVNKHRQGAQQPAVRVVFLGAAVQEKRSWLARRQLHTATMIHVRIAVMSNSSLAVGDRVIRVNDGIVGVIVSIRPGNVGVRWEPSGLIQSIVPHLLKPA